MTHPLTAADQAATERERQRQADDWADYVADMVERQAADDAELRALQERDEARQAGCWPGRTIGADAE